MPAAGPGIKKITLRGRKRRDGTRKQTVRWEVKAYNPQSMRTEYVGRYDTLEEAVKAKERFERAHGRTSAGDTKMTIEEMVNDRYLKRTRTLGRKPRPIKRSTLAANEYSMRPFVREFGSRRADRVDEDVVIAWCETQPAFVVEGVRAMYAWAARKRLVRHNPLDYVESRRGDGRKDLRVIKTKELQRLVVAAQQCWAGVMGLRLAVLLELLAYSGMRPSEAFALRRDNLDFEMRRIYVDWQLDVHGAFQPLKNTRKRVIVMDPVVEIALRRLLVHVEGNDLLFRTVTGCKLNSKSKWSYYWDPIRKKVGFNGMDVYELRHYFATLMLDNGAREEDVAQQLGHSDGGELVRQLYGHPDEEIRRVRLDNVMRNRTREIERRREPEPPRDADAQPDDGDDLTGPADSLAA
ncbi:MAG: tyrosine-type recombinase/integrase [Thermoleophilia bacterium]